MTIRLRIAAWLFVVIATGWVLPAASASANDGGGKGRAPARAAATRKIQKKTTTIRKKTVTREYAVRWVQARYRELARESSERKQEIERMRHRLDRDLLSLRRARVALLRCGART